MEEIDPEHIFYGVLAFMWVEFLWEAYIGMRQRKIYKVSKKGRFCLDIKLNM